ncbi:MAG: hypothetical protein KatS3mg076_1861 [Candidatus Binatia bacterium]|nr:MAG: hypothetical protein KatS3mg076_1861 [Candidatus Binatia bacterium]
MKKLGLALALPVFPVLAAFVPLAFARSAPVSATASENPRAVEILSQRGYWTGLRGPDFLRDAEEGTYFVVSGRLENRSGRALLAVKLAYELLDAEGHVVASEFGYNRRAEALREPDYEAGRLSLESLGVEPLGSGESDDFRMLFLRGDVPRFESWRVRVLEVLPAGEVLPTGEKTRKY